MYNRLFQAATFYVTLSLFTLAASAQVEPEVIRRGKQATALVVLPSGHGFGSAFCIDEAGYFLTNQHVVETVRGGSVTLVLRAGETNETAVEATVVRIDKENDLALLCTTATVERAALPLAEEPQLAEAHPVVAFGYPFGTALRVKEQQFPNVSISVGRITSLRKSNEQLEKIQIDAEVNPGNSGGPLLNQQGEVIGIVHAKVANSGVNFAIPIARVRSFLAEPEISFSPVKVDYKQRYEPQPIRLRVISFLKPRPKYDVRFKLDDGQLQREVELEPQQDDAYAGTVAVLIKSDAAKRLPVEIEFGAGLIRGQLDDTDLDAGQAGARLSALKRIERRGDRWHILGRNLEETLQQKLPLDNLKVYVGKSSFDVPLEDVQAAAISPPPPEPGIVSYEIVVLADGKPLTTQQGQWFITGHPVERAAGQRPGGFYSLDGRSAWPPFLDTPHIAASKEGLSGLGTHCLRTKSGRYLAEDFAFDVVFSVSKDDPIIFVGLGEGRPTEAFRDPDNSVQFRIQSPGRRNGEVSLSKSDRDRGEVVGRIPSAGTHRATISKRGNTVTFAIDIDNDGATPDDIKNIIPNIHDFAPHIHEKNSYLFFGGGGTFHEVRLSAASVLSASYKDSVPESTVLPPRAGNGGELHAFTDEAAKKLDLASATLGKEGLEVRPQSVVRTKEGDFLTRNFRFEVVLTVPEESDREPLDCPIFVGFGEGRFNRHHDLDESVRLRLNPVAHFARDGGVLVGIHLQKDQKVGELRQAGTHHVTVEKRGSALTFAIDVDNDGETPDDIQATIPNVGDFAPFLHGKNGYIFFGGDAVFRSFDLVEQE